MILIGKKKVRNGKEGEIMIERERGKRGMNLKEDREKQQNKWSIEVLGWEHPMEQNECDNNFIWSLAYNLIHNFLVSWIQHPKLDNLLPLVVCIWTSFQWILSLCMLSKVLASVSLMSTDFCTITHHKNLRERGKKMSYSKSMKPYPLMSLYS